MLSKRRICTNSSILLISFAWLCRPSVPIPQASLGSKRPMTDRQKAETAATGVACGKNDVPFSPWSEPGLDGCAEKLDPGI